MVSSFNGGPTHVGTTTDLPAATDCNLKLQIESLSGNNNLNNKASAFRNVLLPATGSS